MQWFKVWYSLNHPEPTWTPQRTCLKLSIRVVQSYWTCSNHSQNCDSFNFLLLWQLLNQLLMATFHPVVWDIVADIPFYLMKVSPSFNPNPRSCFSEVDLNLETCKTTTEKSPWGITVGLIKAREATLKFWQLTAMLIVTMQMQVFLCGPYSPPRANLQRQLGKLLPEAACSLWNNFNTSQVLDRSPSCFLYLDDVPNSHHCLCLGISNTAWVQSIPY